MENTRKFVTALVDLSTSWMDRFSIEADSLLGPWWYLWQFVLQVGILAMASSAFRLVVTPMALLVLSICNSSTDMELRVLHVLYWLTLPVLFAVVKALNFPSPPPEILALLLELLAISYFRIVGDAALHPLEVRFWTYWASHADAQAQLRLARELEKQQRKNRAERSRVTPPTNPLHRQESLDRKLLTEGIEHRKSTFKNTVNNEYYEVKGHNGEFPSEAVMDCYYRCGWHIALFLLREFESNYRFCAPVRWHRNKMTGKIECTNGYKVRVPDDIMRDREDLVFGSVSVLEPWAVKPALELLNEAIGHLKFYSTRYMKQRSLRFHRWYRETVAIHCEYTQFPPEFERSSFRKLDVDVREWEDKRVQNVITGGTESLFVEKDRELINILTITVDRYLVVVFHIAHMMRNADGKTVEAFTRIFEYLMNPLKPKIWLDLPRGVAALDATMEHIYRGYPHEGLNAPRRPPYREFIDSPLRIPSFKDIGSDRYFRVDRPPQLLFPRGRKPCPLGFHGDGVDFAQRSCPCFSGNLDVRDILDTILRTHYFITYPMFARIAPEGMEGTKASTGLDIPSHSSWAEPRVECSYEDFVAWMLAGDKFQPLLHQLRTRGMKAPEPPEVGGLSAAQARKAVEAYEAQLAAHQREHVKFLGFLVNTKGFERNDEQLSYVVGTGIGIAVAFRQLLTCETPRLTAERLSHYGYREKMDIEPHAFETALSRPLPEECYTYGENVLNTFTLGLSFGAPFNRVRPEEGTIVFQDLAADPKYTRMPTHYLIQDTIGQEIHLKFKSTGMQYSGWIGPLESNTGGEEATGGRLPTGNGNYGENITARNIAADVLRKSHRPKGWSGDGEEISSGGNGGRKVPNLMVFMRLVFLLYLHCANDRPLASEIQTMAYTIGKTQQFRALPANQRIAMQSMWESQKSDDNQARAPTAFLQQRTCAEILILMLILEVSNFENIDACRREAYKLDIMRHNYAAYTTRSLYDEPEVRALSKESGLDGEFEYEEPYWLKRLQVLVGPMLARGMTLGDTTYTNVAFQCGFQSLYELLYKLVDEVERMCRLANFHSRLSRALERICKAAKVPIENYRSNGELFANAAYSQGAQGKIDDGAARTRAILGLSWMVPEWCTILMNDYSPRPRVIQSRLLQPYSTRKHDQLKAVGALMRLNPTVEPERWTCFSKWWTRKLRVQALGLADEQVQKFHLPDPRIIWPRDTKDEHIPPAEFGMRIRSLDRQRQETSRLGVHTITGIVSWPPTPSNVSPTSSVSSTSSA